MCDDRTEAEDKDYLERQGTSRRTFGVMSAAALAACASSPADASDVTERDVDITTPEGTADAYFVHPTGRASAGAVMWPDIRGLRPAYRTMGKRLAESGYAVLVPNPYYRSVRGAVTAEGESFSDPAVRERLTPMVRALNAETQVTDGTAFVRWLDSQRAVDTRKKIGAAGYCMTGPFVVRMAAANPERVAAGCSFHGGGLASAENPDSPHLLAPRMRGGFLFAIAQNDDERDPNAKTLLREAFTAANVPAEIEVYPAQHGWCTIDSQVFDQAQADRAWGRMLALFSQHLA